MNYHELHKIAQKTLDQLITDKGIYASTAKGKHGVYHGLFGRDTLITAALVIDAESSQKTKRYTAQAVSSVLHFAQWQGVNANVDTGEEIGKIPHEIRTNPDDYFHLTKGAVARGDRSWYVDPVDNVMKNWDTADATPLWVWLVGTLFRKGLIAQSAMPWDRYKQALEFCLADLKKWNGLAGYSHDPTRLWGGLYHQTWKDSFRAYMSEQTGEEITPPLFDVFVNGIYWSALRMGEVLYQSQDPNYARILGVQARKLKTRFNSSSDGFLMKLRNGSHYFAECLDTNLIQQKAQCIDPAMCLWAQVDGECIIEDTYIPQVIERIMKEDIFDPKAGLRIYSSCNKTYDPLQYHRGPHTYWPFVSGIIVSTLSSRGYHRQAQCVAHSLLAGTAQFGSCIELYLGDEEGLVQYRDPDSGNFGSTDQAWSGAAIVLAYSYLELDVQDKVQDSKQHTEIKSPL